jgi:group I intron endonuclease
MSQISGIYKIVNKVNGKYYVGSSKDILGTDGRKAQHFRELKNHRHCNSHLQAAWDKYGSENFELIVVEEVLPDLLIKTEQKYLNEAAVDKGKSYNKSFIAGKIEMTPELKARLSAIKIGKYDGENNPAYVRVPEEVKLLIKDYWVKHGKNLTILFSKENGVGHGTCLRLIKEFRLDPAANDSRKIFYKMESRKLFKNNESLVRVGKRNFRYNNANYILENVSTGEVFEGKVSEFKDKFGFYPKSDLLNGKRNICKGWVLAIDQHLDSC